MSVLNILNLVAFSVFLAFSLMPFDGRNLGSVAVLYPTMISPTYYAHTIWILIIVTMLCFVVWQLFPSNIHSPFMKAVGIWFLIACILQALWIPAWCYQLLTISEVLMAALFFTLFLLNTRLAYFAIDQRFFASKLDPEGTSFAKWCCCAPLPMYTSPAVPSSTSALVHQHQNSIAPHSPQVIIPINASSFGTPTISYGTTFPNHLPHNEPTVASTLPIHDDMSFTTMANTSSQPASRRGSLSSSSSSSSTKWQLSSLSVYLLRMPFGLWFGWITVVGLLNLTIALEYEGNINFAASNIWAAAAICIATSFGIIWGTFAFDYFYAVSLLWGCIGVYIERDDPKIRIVALSAAIALVIFIIASILIALGELLRRLWKKWVVSRKIESLLVTAAAEEEEEDGDDDEEREVKKGSYNNRTDVVVMYDDEDYADKEEGSQDNDDDDDDDDDNEGEVDHEDEVAEDDCKRKHSHSTSSRQQQQQHTKTFSSSSLLRVITHERGRGRGYGPKVIASGHMSGNNSFVDPYYLHNAMIINGAAGSNTSSRTTTVQV